jgi:hypothetical protein
MGLRFYSIALFLFLFNLILAVYNDPAFGLNYTIQNQADWNVTGSFQQVESSNVSNSFIFGDFLRALQLLIVALAKATVFLPALLAEFALPGVWIALFTAVVWFLYGVAFLQFLGNRVME